MLDTADRGFIEIIESAPGPSPWYVLKRDLGLRCSKGELRWNEAEAPEGHIALQLQSLGGSHLALIDAYVTVTPLPEHGMALWHEVGLRYRHPTIRDSVRIAGIDLDGVEPLRDVSACVNRMIRDGQAYYVTGGEIGQIAIPRGLDAGEFPFEVPESFRSSPTRLVVVGGGPQRPPAIYEVKFGEGIVRSFPQTWIMSGEYDLKYQRLTRAAREPESGRIVVEGIRLGVAVLDEQGTGVDQWLVKHPYTA